MLGAISPGQGARQRARRVGVKNVRDVSPGRDHRCGTQPVELTDVVRALGGDARLDGDGASGTVMLHDVTHDSRSAGPGVLFACRPGVRADGHQYAPAAVAAGSPALLVERPLALGVPEMVVDSVADRLGDVAALVHGRPSRALRLCGVTGTNGKTTVAYLLDSVLTAAGHTTGLIGTVETRIAGETVPGVRTTPEAPDLQRLLRAMVDRGVTAAAMEVSSHGLALGRVTGTEFAVAVFTNLTHDHLDFHGDVESYFCAKAQLFDPVFTPVAVVNVDDSYGRRLVEQARTPVITVSPSGAQPADVTATDVDAGPRGSRVTALLRTGSVPLRTQLPGDFNIANALCALAAAVAIGIDPAVAAEGVAALPGVPGRMEPVDVGQPYTVLVDYAHTPDSLEHVLRAVRQVTVGSVIVVVGCGGDRDQHKRPVMGRAAAALADLAVLTSDNPRSEDPLGILEQMAAGARTVPGGRWTIEPDRRDGICAALAAAGAGDVVVIAGKGHETTQELADGTVPFDDRAVASELLAGQRLP